MTDGHTQRLESALAGRYRIQEKLGEGGMASVYLAEDVKHERNVALKILKPELAAVIGAERFLTEIKTTANLQHPHILPLFDSGEADGFLYYVMPFIDGETLQDRIGREGQLGVEEAVRIARDVADALDYAHRNDIIHRDIKPANILLHDGRPVVADFGIALAISAAGGGRMTETGLSLGTPHYMSPEQASADRDLSARSDVYSLGCVLYEMLAGQPPHTGPSAQNILVRILTEDPRDVTELRRTVPAHVAATVMKSIEKLPADRFDTARQFMDALEDPNFSHVHVSRAVTTPSPAPAAGTPSAAAPAKLVRGMAGALVVLVGLAAWGWLRPAPDVPSPMATRASIDLRGDEVHPFAKLIISPDGSHLAYVSGNEGDRRLWVRRIDEEHFRVLYQGDAFWPAFSPDGDWIAFEQGDALMKVALSGGAPRVVAPERSQVGQPHWGDDRTIVFWDTGRIYRVPETGGEPTLVAELSGESLANPHLLPGGRGLLASSGSSFTTYFVDLERDTIVPLIPGGITARYVDTGHVLYLDEEGGLWARAFDPTSGEVTGEATPVLQGIGLRSNLVGRYDVSRTGTLVYGLGGVTAMAAAPGELVVVGLDGSEEVAPLPPRVIRQVRWAPDGERIAYAGTEPGDLNASWMIYEYNVELQTTPTRLTSEGDVNNYPAWSPDGERIAFSSAREGSVGRDLYVKNVFDDSPPERIFGVNGRSRPDDWLEGDVLVFTTGNSAARNNSWTIQIPDSATAQPYVAAEGNRQWSRVAPQGDLAAYESNETGRYEIFVRAFPEARQPTPVSSGGGLRPRWSPDGNTIYYWREYQGGDSLFAARIQREPAFRVLSTDVVLAGDYRSPDDWDLHPDGDRFVTTRLVETGSATSAAAGIEPERHLMVTNWFTELLAAVGEGN